MSEASRGRMGGYLLERELSRGGMGVVWAGRHAQTGQPVALKVALEPGSSHAQALRREASLLRRLSHPGVIACLDEGEDEGQPWLAMPLLPGRSLEQLMGDASLSWSQRRDLALGVLSQLCQTLAYLHGEGIVHADLKPANVMCHEAQVTLIDLGIATVVGGRLEVERLRDVGLIMGSLVYMAPEQLLGHEVDARTDLYAVGVMLYELLTARQPFEGDSLVGLMFQKVNKRPLPARQHNPAISGVIEDLLTRLLDAKASHRPGHAMLIASALNGEQAGLGQGQGQGQGQCVPWRDYIYAPSYIEQPPTPEQLRQELPPARLLIADAGLGKSRLLFELIRAWRGRGTQVAVTQGRVWEQRRALGVTRELLGQLALALDPLVIQGAPHEALWRALIGQGPMPALLDEQVLTQRLRELLVWIAQVHGQGLPWIWVIDDAQWTDASTLALIAHLIDQPHPLVRVVLAGRPEGPWLELQGQRVELSPMAPDAQRALIEQSLAWRRAPTSLVEAICARSGGSPLRVMDLLSALIQGRWLVRDDVGRWQLMTQAWDQAWAQEPAALSRAALGPASRQALDALAVHARPLTWTQLGQLLELTPDALIPAVLEAQARALLRVSQDGSELDFPSAALSQRWLDLVEPASRQALHARAGRWWSQLAQMQDKTAWAMAAAHLERARLEAEACLAHERAALAALEVYAHGAAQEHYEASLRLAPDVATRARLRLALLHHVFKDKLRFDDWEAALDALEGEPLEPALRHQVMIERVELLHQRGLLTQALEGSARVGQALVPADEAYARWLFMDASLKLSAKRLKEARAQLDALLYSPMVQPSPKQRAAALNIIGQVLNVEGDYEGAQRWLLRSLELRSADDLQGQIVVWHNLAVSFLGQGQLVQALEGSRRVVALQRQIGDSRGMGVTLGNLGRMAASCGLFEDAQRQLHEAMQLNEASDRLYYLASNHQAWAELHMIRAELPQALEHGEAALKLRQRMGSAPGDAMLGAFLAELALEAGDLERASHEAQRVLSADLLTSELEYGLMAELILSWVERRGGPLAAPPARLLRLTPAQLPVAASGRVACEVLAAARLIPALAPVAAVWRPALPQAMPFVKRLPAWALAQPELSAAQLHTIARRLGLLQLRLRGWMFKLLGAEEADEAE